MLGWPFGLVSNTRFGKILTHNPLQLSDITLRDFSDWSIASDPEASQHSVIGKASFGQVPSLQCTFSPQC